MTFLLRPAYFMRRPAKDPSHLSKHSAKSSLMIGMYPSSEVTAERSCYCASGRSRLGNPPRCCGLASFLWQFLLLERPRRARGGPSLASASM